MNGRNVVLQGCWKTILTGTVLSLLSVFGTGVSNAVAAETSAADAVKPANKPGDTEKLYGYWKMDEEKWSGTQGEVKDSSGLGNNAVATNATTVEGGISGRAGSFNGENSMLSLTDLNALDIKDDMTISAWMKTNTKKTDQVIIQKYKAPSPQQGWCFRLSGEQLIFFTDSYASVVMANIASCLDGKWHHVAAVKQIGQPMTLYVDGAPVNTYDKRDVGTQPGNTTGFGVAISWAAPAWCFNGSLDEIRVYGRVLTPAEILALYNNR